MAKWIVYAAPISDRAAETEAETRLFMTDNAAKGYIRDVTKKHFVVRISSAPDVKPAVHMDHGDALRWAHS
jgi:hypothetical protein